MPAIADRQEEQAKATVVELPDGRMRQSGGQTMGGRLVADDGEALPEPVVFTFPTELNKVIAGTFFMVNEDGSVSATPTGMWDRVRRKALPVINGHITATTKGEYDRIKRACRGACYEEPKAADRPKEPLRFLDEQGRIAFWTYVSEAFERFQMHYHRTKG